MYVLTGFTSFSSKFFFLYWSPSSPLFRVFDAVPHKIVQVLSTNPFVNVLVFVDFNVHYKEWLTYPGGTVKGELVNSYKGLTKMLNILTWITDSETHSTGLWNIFLSPDPIIFYAMALSIRKCWPCCLSFHWLPLKFKGRCSFSSRNSWLLSCKLGWSSLSFKRCFTGGYSWSTVLCCFRVLWVGPGSNWWLYIFFIVHIKSGLIQHHGFQVLLLLP